MLLGTASTRWLLAAAALSAGTAFFMWARSGPNPKDAAREVIGVLNARDWHKYAGLSASVILERAQLSRDQLRQFVEGMLGDESETNGWSVRCTERSPNFLPDGRPSEQPLWNTDQRTYFRIDFSTATGKNVAPCDLILMRNLAGEWTFDGVRFAMLLDSRLRVVEEDRAKAILRGLDAAGLQSVADQSSAYRRSSILAYLNGELPFHRIREPAGRL